MNWVHRRPQLVFLVGLSATLNFIILFLRNVLESQVDLQVER